MAKEIEFLSHREENIQAEKNKKQTVYDLHHEACFDLQTALLTATADISNCSYKSKHFTYTCTVCVTVRWKHWVMFSAICGCGEGKQEVLLKQYKYIMLIAVLDGVATFANNSNIVINVYSHNCGGQ